MANFVQIPLMILAACFGAILFRVRGGLWGERMHTTTLEARLIFSAGMSMLAVHIYESSIALGIILFLSCMPGWHGGIDLGRKARKWWEDACILALRGLVFTCPCALFLEWFAHKDLWLAAVGLLTVPAYEIGYRIRSNISGLHTGMEIGEAAFGACLGAAFFFL